tara:strand:- start:1896 stop:2558 length:663 start_codon:yes stop_codon:yes gene_type:complete
MRVAALIPFWESYETNQFRIKKIAGRFLMSYAVEKLNSVNLINDIYVYSSSKRVSNYIEPNLKYTYLNRSKSLDNDKASIESIISSFLKEVEVDVVVLLHPTSPFLKVDSITKALNLVINGECDSSFSAVKYSKFAWLNSKPINYDLNNDVPSLKSINPIYFEQSSLYVFKTLQFLKNNHRLSGDIKLTEINRLEGLEIRNKVDFELAELIINSGMSEVI